MNGSKRKYIQHYLLGSFLFFVVIFVQCRTIEINSRSRLFARINESYIAAVQFYCYDRKSPCQKSDYQELKARFNAVSQNSSYRQANIDFILMNCKGDRSITRELGISKLPTLMLFVNGMPIPGAQISGFAHECDMNALLENYLGNTIDKILDQKAEDRAREQELQIAAWTAWGPYWNCGYGYGCCRPGWGFYGSWGGGCGW